ncbi:hypothetical protein CUJ83_14485 [Methanocella sp. CWC-04]|uniref:Butirosin biosynthesis protein H, N-terminal n=1 Tax=Methanooceanicella nereidis TaxID=2052831 RepID=A0AAP2RHA3_9EURY|nr:BtrH N-terminal domain-containing protein [Methanocella sp. CWC-04]MCD1296207.1 hypothetical protein [Methanocella sp. CWC-04]
MRYILIDFEHEKGVQSDTTCLRDMFAFEGSDIPEAALFGLGEGLSFFYWESKNLRRPTMGCRTGVLDLDKKACQSLGVEIRVRTSRSPKRAYGQMKKMLMDKMPVMMHVDSYYLNYAGKEQHNGAYSVISTGVDEDSDIVFLADHRFDDIIELPISRLIEARASLHKPFPPQHRWFEFSFPEEVNISTKCVIDSISANTIAMLNPQVRNVGVGGIYYLANSIRLWRDLYSQKEVEDMCDEAYMTLYGDGLYPGCLRHLYADFLSFAYEVTDIGSLKDVSEGYGEAGNMWTRAAKMFGEVKCGCVSLSEIADAMTSIAEKEHQLQTELLCAVNLGCKRNGGGKK